jgi:hypothetical protein
MAKTLARKAVRGGKGGRGETGRKGEKGEKGKTGKYVYLFGTRTDGNGGMKPLLCG